VCDIAHDHAESRSCSSRGCCSMHWHCRRSPRPVHRQPAEQRRRRRSRRRLLSISWIRSTSRTCSRGAASRSRQPVPRQDRSRRQNRQQQSSESGVHCSGMYRCQHHQQRVPALHPRDVLEKINDLLVPSWQQTCCQFDTLQHHTEARVRDFEQRCFQRHEPWYGTSAAPCARV